MLIEHIATRESLSISQYTEVVVLDVGADVHNCAGASEVMSYCEW